MSINLLLLAIATSLSPLFVLTSVVMMSSTSKVHNSWAAVVGWMVSIGVSAAAIMLIGAAVIGNRSIPNTRWMGALDVVLAALLAGLALREWRRFRADPDSAMPKWFHRVGTMSLPFAFGIGVFLPPTILAYAAGNEIAQQHISSDGRWVALGLYIIIGSLIEALPVLWFTLRPSRRASTLPRWNAWLSGHWQEVVAVLFAGLSVFLLFKGAVVLVQSK